MNEYLSKVRDKIEAAQTEMYGLNTQKCRSAIFDKDIDIVYTATYIPPYVATRELIYFTTGEIMDEIT